MQPVENFNPNLGTAIALLGPPGSGKTVLGCRLFKKTYINITDPNFESAKRYLTEIGEIKHVVGYDTVLTDEAGKKVPVQMWAERFGAQLKEAAGNPEIDAMFLDGGSYIADILVSHIAGSTDENQIRIPPGTSSYDKWALYLMAWKGLIIKLRQTGKKVIVAFHEKMDKSEADGMFRNQIMLDGQIKDKIPYMFSDVWRTEVEENLGTYKRVVRCLGNNRNEMLKNTYSLPGVILQDELVKIVREKTYGKELM